MLLITNGLDATTFQDQDESLPYPSQDRDQGSIVDDAAHVHSGNQRIYVSETNIQLKYDGKEMCINITIETKKEREALPVTQLAGSERFALPEIHKD